MVVWLGAFGEVAYVEVTHLGCRSEKTSRDVIGSRRLSAFLGVAVSVVYQGWVNLLSKCAVPVVSFVPSSRC